MWKKRAILPQGLADAEWKIPPAASSGRVTGMAAAIIRAAQI